jgi:hypothetical protein
VENKGTGKILLTVFGQLSQYRVALSPLGVSPREIHPTLFSQGNPRANGSLAQLKVNSIKI